MLGSCLYNVFLGSFYIPEYSTYSYPDSLSLSGPAMVLSRSYFAENTKPRR